MRDPILHTHHTDELPSDHPLALTNIDCASCGGMLHANYNENMQNWVETGKGNYCLPCFVKEGTDDGEGTVTKDDWGL